MSRTIELSKSLTTHKGEIKSITLREPSAKQFFTHGEAFKVRAINMPDGSQNLEFDYNMQTLRKWLLDLCDGVNEIELDDLSPTDLYSLRNAITDMVLGTVGDRP